MITTRTLVQRAVHRLDRAVWRQENAKCNFVFRLHIVDNPCWLCIKSCEGKRERDMQLIADHCADRVLSGVGCTATRQMMVQTQIKGSPRVYPVFVVEQQQNFKLVGDLDIKVPSVRHEFAQIGDVVGSPLVNEILQCLMLSRSSHHYHSQPKKVCDPKESKSTFDATRLLASMFDLKTCPLLCTEYHRLRTRIEGAWKVNVDVEVGRLAANKVAERQCGRHLDKQQTAGDCRLKADFI